MERVDFADFLRKIKLTQSRKNFPRIIIVPIGTDRIRLTGVELGNSRVTIKYVRPGVVGGWNTQTHEWVVFGYYVARISRTRGPNHFTIITLEEY